MVPKSNCVNARLQEAVRNFGCDPNACRTVFTIHDDECRVVCVHERRQGLGNRASSRATDNVAKKEDAVAAQDPIVPQDVFELSEGRASKVALGLSFLQPLPEQ